MDTHDEAFFETLSARKTAADNEYEIELTKASSGALSTATTRPKIIRTKNEEETENDGQEEASWSEGEPEGKLTVDVYQTATAVVVESAIAGVKAGDIDINVTSDSITIRGSRKREKTVKDEDYLYQECYWGKFARTIILPQEIDPENAEVTFKNGILTVHLPKANRKKSRKLKIVID